MTTANELEQKPRSGLPDLTVGLGWLKYAIGGGVIKYRVRGVTVEMKGGGTGFFWGFAHFVDFETAEEAEIAARRWAKKEGGIFIPNLKGEQCP